MMARTVTEQDLRAPEFKDGVPGEYEFRSDGKIVRKDRWERGIRKIFSALNMPVGDFEIDDVVEKVRGLVASAPTQKED